MTRVALGRGSEVVLSLGLTLVLAGCVSITPAPSRTATTPPSSSASSTPSASATPTQPSPGAPRSSAPQTPGTGRIEVPELGFALTLADGWTQIPLDRQALDAFIATIPPDSDFGRILSGQAGQMIRAGVKLWAFDLRPSSTAGGFAPNMNVFGQPGEGQSMADLAAAAKAQLELIDGVSNVTPSTITLPAGEAARLTYSVKLTLADGNVVNATGAQYYVIADPNLLVFTFSCSSAHPAACSDESTTMIQSLELIGPGPPAG